MPLYLCIHLSIFSNPYIRFIFLLKRYVISVVFLIVTFVHFSFVVGYESHLSEYLILFCHPILIMMCTRMLHTSDEKYYLEREEGCLIIKKILHLT